MRHSAELQKVEGSCYISHMTKQTGKWKAFSPLQPKEQFWWGFFGGCMVLAFRLWAYANSLTPDAPWPNPCFRTFLLCGVWFAFPIVAGLLSRVCDPHHRLIAVFEGASAPALFFFIASHSPF
jgi:hypothetical protein